MKKIKRKIKILICIILNRIFILIFPLQKNKVTFLSDVRKVMGGNLECVYEYLDDCQYKKIIALKVIIEIREDL